MTGPRSQLDRATRVPRIELLSFWKQNCSAKQQKARKKYSYCAILHTTTSLPSLWEDEEILGSQIMKVTFLSVTKEFNQAAGRYVAWLSRCQWIQEQKSELSCREWGPCFAAVSSLKKIKRSLSSCHNLPCTSFASLAKFLTSSPGAYRIDASQEAAYASPYILHVFLIVGKEVYNSKERNDSIISTLICLAWLTPITARKP